MGRFIKNAIFSGTRRMLVKLVIVFTMLMSVIFTGGLWLNINAQLNVRKQIVESVEMQVSFVADSFFAELHHLHTQQILLANDYSLQLLLLYNDTSDMSAINTNLRRANTRLSAIVAASPHVIDVGYYLPGLNRMSSFRGSLFYVPTAQDRMFLDAINVANHFIVPYEEDLVMLHDIFSSRLLRSDAACFIRLSGSELKNTLEQIATPYDLSALMRLADETVLYTDNFADKEYQEILENELSKSAKEPYLLRNGTTSYWVIRSPLPRWDIEIIAFLPAQEVNNSVIPMMILTIILFTVVLLGSVAFFTFYIQRAMIRPVDKMVYEQQLAVEKARFKQLQSQITPHFLYNSFYQLYRLGKMGDMELTSELSLSLSRYYQYITRDRDDIVPLRMEIEHASNYAMIQNIRFGNRITCVIDKIPEIYCDLMVPKLIIQPLLENSYEHGLETRETSSQIKVSFHDVDKDVCVCVEDDGDSFDDETLADLQEKLDQVATTDETTGILNINQRLVYLYGGAPRLRISRTKSGGFGVVLYLQKEL